MRQRAPRQRASPDAPKGASPGRTWTFLSNHAHVLICVASNPSMRIQEIAAQVGITYRGVQRILGELEEAGYLTRTRARADARSNEYRVDRSLPLRHPLERHQRVAAVLDLGTPRRASPG